MRVDSLLAPILQRRTGSGTAVPAGDGERIENVVAELIRLKGEHPQRFNDTLPHIRSMPDWLTKGPDMRVPCDAYRMIWVGADGTVKMCYVTFTRLRDLMFTPAHQQAARGAYD